MFAINHAATALIIKKIFKDVPIIWILLSVQLVELLWVLLNYLGIEKTTTEKEVKYVGDVHLSYMPYSHSIISMLGIAIIAWLILSKGFDLNDIGLAVGIGILSHLLLDLITHGRDISMALLSIIRNSDSVCILNCQFPHSFWRLDTELLVGGYTVVVIHFLH